MQRLKNRKRLTALALVFMLTFLGAAAFAFAPGTLDIVGTVNVTALDELYVVWHSVEYDWAAGAVYSDGFVFAPITDASIALGAYSSATFQQAGSDERTFQTILWTLNFDRADFDYYGYSLATLVAVARNNSTTFAAEITAEPSFSWSDPVLAAELGLTATDAVMLSGLNAASAPMTANGGLSEPLTVTVEWDGTIPATATPGQTFGPLTLTILVPYGPVMP